MRKIKVVVLLVQQLQHGFTKNAKVSPNLTVAQIQYPPVNKIVFSLFGMQSGGHFIDLIESRGLTCSRDELSESQV